ncbi:hypothetical protein FKM82_006380 [Ascaphus truei]
MCKVLHSLADPVTQICHTPTQAEGRSGRGDSTRRAPLFSAVNSHCKVNDPAKTAPDLPLLYHKPSVYTQPVHRFGVGGKCHFHADICH